MINIKKKEIGNYLLFYHLNYSVDAIKVAKEIANKKGLSLIEINGQVKPLRNSYRFKQTIGPSEFIDLFANASFVISTSFHGVAFSLIFKKQFFTLGLQNNSQRVTNMLEMLNISDRYIYNKKSIINIKEIDYDKIDSILHEEIKKSSDFLVSSILSK